MECRPRAVISLLTVLVQLDHLSCYKIKQNKKTKAMNDGVVAKIRYSLMHGSG